MNALFPLCLAALLAVGCQTSERATLKPTSTEPEVIIEPQVDAVPESPKAQTPEVEGYLNLGVRYYAEGRYRDALEQFNRVLALDPGNKIVKKYADECTMYLTPGAVEEHVVEYPEAPN
jgi:tetratricopeptide (TPR) repeat protein